MEPAKRSPPERPSAVPPSGFWNDSLGKWEVSQQGADGVREGECLFFLPDGTFHSRRVFAGGVENGPFVIYHPDGRVSREGRFAGGYLDGLIVAHAPEGQGEPLRVCCVPPGAARLDMRYRAGDLLVEVFYDRQGRALLADGTPAPPRPRSLPDPAVFDESRGGWALCTEEVNRFWTAEGALLEESARTPDGGRWVRTFDGAGELREEQHFGPDGRPNGPFRRRYGDAAPPPYADARVREERGAFERGQAVGRWTFLDGAGEVLRAVDRGTGLEPASAGQSPALANQLGDGWALADALIDEGRVREGLCAAARAAARTGDRAALLRRLEAHAMPLAPEAEAERGAALEQKVDADAVLILDALMQGTNAAAVFRALTAVLPPAGLAAVDFVEASLLLAPERRMTHVTRALIRAQRGDEAGARADAAIVEAEVPEAAASLRDYLRLIFRPFAPAAAREAAALDPSEVDVEVPVGQSLEAVRHLAAVYATRIARVRDALLRFVAGAPAWLPPDLSAFTPAGPVSLRRETIVCEPDPEVDEEGAEPPVVELDEGIATEGASVPALLALARADFAALDWLCWSVGGRDVALPERIEPPAALGAAMQMIVKRHWRARDRLSTGGLLARANGVPGFAWQGIEIDALPTHLVPAVSAEYLASRSMFLWLVSGETLSPFQDDVRDA